MHACRGDSVTAWHETVHRFSMHRAWGLKGLPVRGHAPQASQGRPRNAPGPAGRPLHSAPASPADHCPPHASPAMRSAGMRCRANTNAAICPSLGLHGAGLISIMLTSTCPVIDSRKLNSCKAGCYLNCMQEQPHLAELGCHKVVVPLDGHVEEAAAGVLRPLRHVAAVDGGILEAVE